MTYAELSRDWPLLTGILVVLAFAFGYCTGSVLRRWEVKLYVQVRRYFRGLPIVLLCLLAACSHPTEPIPVAGPCVVAVTGNVTLANGTIFQVASTFRYAHCPPPDVLAHAFPKGYTLIP